MAENSEQKVGDTIAQNWATVVEQVDDACRQAGRSNNVMIVGVSKYVGPELTMRLIEAGCTILGENRPQALWEKYAWMEEHAKPQPQWHMIGHLQRNKVRRTLPMLSYLHSVDSLRLAKSLSQEAMRTETCLPVLIEVNVSQDESKTGMETKDLDAFIDRAQELEGIRIQGLMAMASNFSGGEQARREFCQVRTLRDELHLRYPDLKLNQLSMGMSGDFREAIAEGATIIRVGSCLWQGVMD